MPGQHALLECTVCQKYPIRSDNMNLHMRKHINCSEFNDEQKDSSDIEDDYELDSVDDQDKEEQMDDMQENEEDEKIDVDGI